MLRIAVIGMGVGKSHGEKLHKSGKAEFAAFVNRDPAKTAGYRKALKDSIGIEPPAYNSLEELLRRERNLAGVIISTPSGIHHEAAVVAAEAGLNLLIDKPIGITTEQIDRIEHAVTRAGVLCGTIYHQRCHPVHSGIRHALHSGLLGRPLICDLRLKNFRTQEYYDQGGWRGTWAMDGGASLMNQGAHPMDLLCWFLGKPVSVMGEFAALNHKMESDDWASGTVVFESGARSTISTTTCAAPKHDHIALDVHGSTGSIYTKGAEVQFSSVENLASLAPPPFESPLLDFVDAIEKRRAPMVGIPEARRSVALINALYQSSREGRRISF